MSAAAEALGVTREVLKGWVRSGRIPHFRVGRRVMFRVKTLELWMDQNEVPAWAEGKEVRRPSLVEKGSSKANQVQ